MNYIRTEDGKIIELPKKVITTIVLNTKIGDLKSGYIAEYKGIEVIKQADTIEELCDEFVVEDKDEFAIFHNSKLAKQTKGIVYGAIWTDKGLIYVAKMNEKGELELL